MRKRLTLEERLELESKVLRFYETERLDKEEIVEELGSTKHLVYNIIKDRNRRIRQNRANIFHVLGNVETLEDFCFHLNFKSPSGLFAFCRDKGLNYPTHLDPWDYNLEIGNGVRAGLSMSEIAKETGVSKQAVHQYLSSSLLIMEYKRIQDKKKGDSISGLRKSRGSLVTLLNLRKRELELEEFAQENDVDKTSFAYRKLSEIRRGHPKVKAYSLNQLYNVFFKYWEGLDGESKPSYQEMADFAGLKYHSDVQKILGFVGLKTFNKKYCNRLSVTQKEAIRRGLKLQISYEDIAYIVGCNSKNFFSLKNPDIVNRRISFYAYTFSDGSGEKLSYRVASQIYEAKDADFSDDDTLELIDGCSQRKIDYAVENRGEIEGFIINCLRHMFPLRNIDKGYL